MVFISTLVNLLGLASSLWLGFYIVTRSPRSRVSWLTALILWSLSCFFFSNALAINMPESEALLWPRFLILFALPLWLHLTLELIAIGTPPARRAVPTSIIRIGIGLSYAGACFLVFVGIFMPASILDLPSAPRLRTSDPGIGPLYPLILVLLPINIALALGILYRGRRAALSTTLRRQFAFFLIATVLAAAGGWYVAAGTQFDLRLPTFVCDGMLAAGITSLGYAVAKYNALIEGSRIEKEFLYAMLAVGSLTLFYILVALALYLTNQISFLTLVLTIVGSLSFNALYDGIRVALDRLFYRVQFVQLRQDLRPFARELGTGQRLDEQLQAALVSFCHALRVRKGFIELMDTEAFAVRATSARRVDRRIRSVLAKRNRGENWRPIPCGHCGVA